MVVCDRCRNNLRGTLSVVVSIDTNHAFDGADIKDHQIDLCRDCFGELSKFVLGDEYNPVARANAECVKRHE